MADDRRAAGGDWLMTSSPSRTSNRRLNDHSQKIKLLPGVIEQVSKHDKKIEDLRHTVFGNGDIGMDEQLRNIWAWIELQKQAQEKRIDFWNRFSWLIITAIVTGFLAFVVQFIVFWVRIVPEL